MNKAKFQRTVKLAGHNNNTRILQFTGRDAWAIEQLTKAGEQGCTPIDQPAPRWSAYIFNLRKAGVSIETITEPHGGNFAGNHARYVLRSRVEFLPEGRS